MKVALTGATGFVGSHKLTELHRRGHEVMALVRNDAQADTVAAAGAISPSRSSGTAVTAPSPPDRLDLTDYGTVNMRL